MPTLIDVKSGRQQMYKALLEWVNEVTDHKRIVRDRRNKLADRWLTDEGKEEIKEEFRTKHPDIDFGRPLAPRLFLNATQGIGKTDAVCGKGGAFHRLLNNGVGKLLAVAPSHKLAREFYDKFILFGEVTDIFHVRGRNQPAVDYEDFIPVERANGDTMCKIPALVDAMHLVGIDVTRSWCMAKGMCPYASSCDWLNQREDVKVAPVVVATHDSLYTPIIGNPTFDVAFVDEELRDFKQVHKVKLSLGNNAGLTTVIEFSQELLDELESPEQRKALQDIGYLQHKLAVIFRDNAGKRKLLKALRSANINLTQLRLCTAYLNRYKRIIQSEVLAELAQREYHNPDKLIKDGQQHIQQLKNVPFAKIAAIFELVLLELRNEVEDECTSLYCEVKNSDDGQEYYVGGSRWVKPNLPNSIAVLHADGTGNEEIVKETFGQHIKTVVINVERNIVASLVKQSNYSKTSLGKYYKGAERKYKEMQQITEREKFDSIICHDETVSKMSLIYPDSVWKTANDLGIHFKKLRGLNVYEDCNYLAIFSMPLPPVHAVETIAKAIALHRGVRFNPIPREEGSADTRQYPKRIVEVTTKHNRKHKINVHYHPDSIGELVRYQMCEIEVVQGIDRIRGVNATETKRIAVFANTAIKEIEWTECIRYSDFKQRGFTRVDDTLFNLGVLPLSPTLWVTMCDEIVPHVFEKISNKSNTSNLEISKLRNEHTGLVDDLEHKNSLMLGRHPTEEGIYEFLVCVDIDRPPQRSLSKQYFIVHGISHENALEKVIMQVNKIPNHWVKT